MHESIILCTGTQQPVLLSKHVGQYDHQHTSEKN